MATNGKATGGQTTKMADMAETTTYTIKALDESTWHAFAALVERNNGVFGGCWCIGFHPEGGDRQRRRR